LLWLLLLLLLLEIAWIVEVVLSLVIVNLLLLLIDVLVLILISIPIHIHLWLLLLLLLLHGTPLSFQSRFRILYLNLIDRFLLQGLLVNLHLFHIIRLSCQHQFLAHLFCFVLDTFLLKFSCHSIALLQLLDSVCIAKSVE
jgi:hypothetical protein